MKKSLALCVTYGERFCIRQQELACRRFSRAYSEPNYFGRCGANFGTAGSGQS